MVDSDYSLGSTRELLDRQIRIWGEENQCKLQDSNVLLLGGDYASEMVLAGLVGLGVGNILVMDNSSQESGKASFLAPKCKSVKRIRKFPETLNKINPFVNVKSVKSFFSRSLLNYYNFNPQVIIDTTNNYSSKMSVLDYLQKRKGKVFLSSFVNKTKCSVTRFINPPNNSNALLDSNGIADDSEQGISPSGIAAGIILEELRKELISLDGDSPLEKKVMYNINSIKRTSIINDLDNNPSKEYLDTAKCLVAGAGGIGTYVALNLALSGFKNLDILDYDEVSETNLNRQILFYEKVGQKKAKTLKQRIKKMKSINARDFSEEKYKINSESFDFLRKRNYSMIFGCFDNVRARYLLNYFAVDLKIPYIDGGTSSSLGSVFSYYPRNSACVSCKKNLDLEEEVHHSCAHADPSVVMPNMIVGSMMVGEAMNLLSGRDRRCSTIAYDNNHPQRIYQKPSPPRKSNCRC
jgi:molybdopterin/thiamine biosynthesis adenylyltransferase